MDQDAEGETPREVGRRQSVGMSRASAMLAMGALLGVPFDCLGGIRSRSEPEEKPCLHCGKMKRHNNSFCSAECCRAHRGRK